MSPPLDISRLGLCRRKFTLVEFAPRLAAHHIWPIAVNDYEAVERDP
jgi:hypothetical protein